MNNLPVQHIPAHFGIVDFNSSVTLLLLVSRFPAVLHNTLDSLFSASGWHSFEQFYATIASAGLDFRLFVNFLAYSYAFNE